MMNYEEQTRRRLFCFRFIIPHSSFCVSSGKGMPLLEIRNLCKRYGTVTALKGLSLDIERGEFFGLLGPNGAGKSTTINILLGLILADSGSIQVFDQDFATQQVAIRRRMNVAAAFTSLNGVL